MKDKPGVVGWGVEGGAGGRDVLNWKRNGSQKGQLLLSWSDCHCAGMPF